MAIITFSIKQSQQERLEAYLKEGESLNLCAKRLLLDLIDEGLDEQLDDKASDRLSTLETIVTDLQEKIACLENDKRQKEIEENSINTHELAKILGVDRSTVSRWKAKEDPRLDGWIQNDDGKWIKH
ncbi:MAG: hypothetical protein ACRC2V_26935 [Xenococcaceae cyanobacterium]